MGVRCPGGQRRPAAECVSRDSPAEQAAEGDKEEAGAQVSGHDQEDERRGL